MYIIVYSKYSTLSTHVVSKAKDKLPNLDLYYLCIDNSLVREQVLKDKQISLTQVPCILVKRLDIIEKYEGTRAIDYLEFIITENNPELPTPVETPVPVTSSDTSLNVQENNGQTSTPIDELVLTNTPGNTSGTPVSSTSTKAADVMSAALSMQKERESVEPKKSQQHL